MELDYLIVGAGASGCALASRLSEDSTVRVLLLEAGHNGPASALAQIPRALPAVLRSGLLTSYATSPATGPGDAGYWVRGRGVGGSTLVNGMMYLRGEPAAYDDLAAATGSAWGWPAFRSAFEEIERRYLHPSPTSLSELDRLVLESFGAAGLPPVDDVNRTTGSRAGAAPASIVGGRRRSAATLLAPGRARGNLRVLTGTRAGSLLWQGRRVVGVLARRGDEQREIRARTVVLCAGTIETPLLLERSGIGPAALLHRAGTAVRVDSPRVGERVREQSGQALQLRLRRRVADSAELGSIGAIVRAAGRYALTRGGPLARPAYDIAALIAPTGPASGPPGTDPAVGTQVPGGIQVMAAPFALAAGGVLRPAGYPGVLLSGYPVRPNATTSIHHDPRDPHGAPVITTSPAADDADQVATLQALRRLAYAGRLGELVEGEDHAGPGAPGSAVYHAVGSVAMGGEDSDPVDPELAVRGVAGLRVADLSVLPFHPSGGTAATAMALGWVAGGALAAQRDR